jgi:hypothetical protein
MPTATDRYRLGRNCTITLDGQLLRSVTDLAVRRQTTEIACTGFQHNAQSALVTHRTLELDLELLQPTEVARLRAAEARGAVVTVTTANGLREFTHNFTVHESTADEPLDDAIRPRFTLKQWSHPKP